MGKHLTLPAEVHDHFRKANILHGYVQKSLDDAVQHALETGHELLAAKATIPHGSWETECDRLFDGSARTARFYMEFSRHFSALPKTAQNSVLFLEPTISGAAKAAKAAAKPKDKKPPDRVRAATTAQNPETGGQAKKATPTPAGDSEYGKCPNCAGTKWDSDEFGVSCSKCHHPYGEPAGDLDDGNLKTQRQKTVKTIEALMRAFDDLQTIKARPELGDVMDSCKALLKIAKGWK